MMQDTPTDDSEPASMSNQRRAHARDIAKQLLSEASGENEHEQAVAAQKQAREHLAQAQRQVETASLTCDILAGVVDETEFVEETAEELADGLVQRPNANPPADE